MSKRSALLTTVAVLMLSTSALAGAPFLCNHYLCDEPLPDFSGDGVAIVDLTLTTLEEQETWLAQMEVIRRAAIALTRLEQPEAHRQATNLCLRLLDRLARTAPEAVAQRAERSLQVALAVFTLKQARLVEHPDGLPYLEQALALRPQRGELHLTAALYYMMGSDQESRSKLRYHLAQAARVAKPGTDFHRTLAETFGKNGRYRSVVER